jgi:hypothetical protein
VVGEVTAQQDPGLWYLESKAGRELASGPLRAQANGKDFFPKTEMTRGRETLGRNGVLRQVRRELKLRNRNEARTHLLELDLAEG